ncbi:malate dehydrogenase (oxaloacetate-decarboxylating)(NADP+) [Dysgonomonas hofstadii]|uniref:Malate dehydrogenase (Oxaloacetate-decarboxylating)(NADP+) n=1 Tax=Dysgonomonas hofstadii TaxID=637886 RepID=A0A840CT09_9BACT|nr:NADP-dependent malic enzyme [Dysgonomonas hofstadii]MBB4036804.1 malate dehydrogenase (oxaloacetate-decarboxylating)(NADP+) [Dysgonomonas hofstadii]
MSKVTRDAALKYHASGKPGKIEVIPTKPHSTQTDLSLAYSPGVAEPCLEIEKDPQTAYDYTAKGNLVAVISNGTAVLGLGNIGALAGKPVMEGKGLLFKIFAGIDVFDIEVDETDPEKFIQTVKAISPTFGGINLEDIKSPECFEIERRLKEELNIPVMHDDQHGTAIISAAALLNALDLANKDISKVRIVVNGAGASAIACTRLYMKFGLRKENIIMCDRNGVLNTRRGDLDESKIYFAADTPFDTLEDAIKGADVFIGLSVGNVLKKEMVQTMNDNPIVFALANPDPEISYEDAMASRNDIIFATGRSDYPNQVNNVLGFPYIFRGALDVRATTINLEMELAAARAIAQLAKEPVPDVINTAYELKRVSFGKEYIIPKPMDPRLLTVVSSAVAKAAIATEVAQRKITDWEAYENSLSDMLGYSNKLIHRLTNLAKSSPKRVVYCEGNHINMMKAAVFALKSQICQPVLLGSIDRINNLAKENGLDLTGIEIIDHRCIREDTRRSHYARILSERKSREGIFYQEAFEKMNDRNYFGMMMVETGDADAVITGIYSQYRDFARTALEVIGLKPGYNHFAAMHIVQTRRGPYFLADTLINRWPNEEVLRDIVRLTHESVKYFATDPVMAMLSFSNFGTEDDGTPKIVSDVIKYFHENYPEYNIDGEMQLNFAMNKELRDEKFPFNTIKGKEVNTLIFPNLSSSNIASKLLIELGIGGESIGPIQMGLRKSVHFMDVESPVRDIINITTVAVVEAIVSNKEKI